jgi:hypothetical protein
VASNPNDIKPPVKGKHALFGIPVWAWAVGAGAFVIAVFIFFRQSQGGTPSGQANAASGAVPAGATSPTVYPFFMGNTQQQPTQSQQFGMATLVGDTTGPYAGDKIALSSTLGGPPAIWLNQGTPVQVLGPAVQSSWAGQPLEVQPVSYLGSQYYSAVNNLQAQPTFNSLGSLNQQAPSGIYG